MPMRLYGDGRRKIARIYQSGLRHRRNHQISIYRLSLSCSPRRPRPSGACREGEIIGKWLIVWRVSIYFCLSRRRQPCLPTSQLPP